MPKLISANVYSQAYYTSTCNIQVTDDVTISINLTKEESAQIGAFVVGLVNSKLPAIGAAVQQTNLLAPPAPEKKLQPVEDVIEEAEFTEDGASF